MKFWTKYSSRRNALSSMSAYTIITQFGKLYNIPTFPDRQGSQIRTIMKSMRLFLLNAWGRGSRSRVADRTSTRSFFPVFVGTLSLLTGTLYWWFIQRRIWSPRLNAKTIMGVEITRGLQSRELIKTLGSIPIILHICWNNSPEHACYQLIIRIHCPPFIIPYFTPNDSNRWRCFRKVSTTLDHPSCVAVFKGGNFEQESKCSFIRTRFFSKSK